jgi:acetyl esterase/lipase
MALGRRSFLAALSLPSAAFGLPGRSGAHRPEDPAVRLSPRTRTIANLPYREPDSRDPLVRERCQLDIHYPVGPARFPTVVWFHGGGLTAGRKELPSALLEQGIGVVGVGYRLSPGVQSPVWIEDAAAAVAWVFRHIAEYGGDPSRIVVSGHSAGGYLAAMVGLDKRWLAPYDIHPDRLAGIAPLSPQAITHFTVRKERGIPDTRPIVDDLAPLYHVRKDAPPILLVTGDREKELLGRYEENAYFWRMLKVAGHPDVTLTEIPGTDHGSMARPAMPMLLAFVRRVCYKHVPGTLVYPSR